MALALLITALSPTRVVPGIAEIVWDGLLLPVFGDAIVGVSWTLRHEMLFYALFGLCIVHRLLGRIILSVWFGAILFNMVFNWDVSGSALLKLALSPFNVQFFMGMAAAWLVRKSWLGDGSRWFLWGAGAFIIFGLAENFKWFDGYGLGARWMYGLSAMVMVVGLVSSEVEFTNARALLALGRASYSIYLSHLIGIGVAYKLWEQTGWLIFCPTWLVYLSLCAAGIGLGVLMSRWIEYPLMRIVRSLLPIRSTIH